MINPKNSKSKKHVFLITNPQENVYKKVEDLINFSVKRKNNVNVKYSILNEQDILLIEFEKPRKLNIEEWEYEETHFKKIPYKEIFNSLSYYKINLNNLNLLN